MPQCRRARLTTLAVASLIGGVAPGNREVRADTPQVDGDG